MRAFAFLFAAGLFVLPQLASSPARAEVMVDDNTQTECKGERCVGSYCNQDGDATNCWRESSYRRKGNEEVHYVCYKPGHHCKWIIGPMPETDKWNVLQIEK